SALIPLGVGAVLALGHVQSLLVEQGHARLAQISEGYAAYLYDRLTAASERTHEIAARVARGASVDGDDNERLQHQFKAIAVVDPTERTVRFDHGSATALRLPLAPDSPVVSGRIA